MLRRHFFNSSFSRSLSNISQYQKFSKSSSSSSIPIFARRFHSNKSSSSTSSTHHENIPPFSAKMKTFLKSYWFPLLIPVVVVACISYPKVMHPTEGFLEAGKWRHLLVPTMFLAAGLSVPVDLMLASFFSFRAHLFVQLSSLILLPLIGFAFVKTADALFRAILPPEKNPLSKEFMLGMIVLSCTPTTIGLATAVARALHVDVPLTIVNSVLGNLLGILFTPFMFVQLTGYQASMDAVDVIKKLSVTVVLPLLVGLFFRAKVLPSHFAHTVSPYLSPLQQICILTFLSTVVSQNAETVRKAVKIQDVPLLLTTIVIMYGVFFHAILVLSKILPCFANESQRVAGLLSSTQKTAAMGVSIMSLLFEGDPALPIVLLPLMMYHPAQVGASTVFAMNAMRRGWTKNVFGKTTQKRK